MSMWVVTMGINQLLNCHTQLTKVIHRIPIVTSHSPLVESTPPIAITCYLINIDKVIKDYIPII